VDPFATSAVAVFSAMLQTDATFIGIGALFVIFKLQLLQTQYERLLISAKNQLSPTEALVLGWHQDLRDEDVIREMFKDGKIPPVVQLVLSNDRESQRIRRLTAIPFVILSVHLVTAAIQLWATPFVFMRFSDAAVPYVGVSIAIFIAGLSFSFRSVWLMSVKHEDLTLLDWDDPAGNPVRQPGE
jgi:hypothetical protein